MNLRTRLSYLIRTLFLSLFFTRVSTRKYNYDKSVAINREISEFLLDPWIVDKDRQNYLEKYLGAEKDATRRIIHTYEVGSFKNRCLNLSCIVHIRINLFSFQRDKVPYKSKITNKHS